MTDFERASARTHRLAHRLLREGVEPHLVTDSMITEGLSVWAADTGNVAAARFLTGVWAKFRDAAHGQ